MNSISFLLFRKSKYCITKKCSEVLASYKSKLMKMNKSKFVQIYSFIHLHMILLFNLICRS